METTNQVPNELVKVEEITSIMKAAPEVIAANQKSVEKCKEAGQALLDTISGNGHINSDELDEAVTKFIEKSKATVKKMNERRTPITQLLTRVSKIFTGFENDIDITKSDTVPFQLQKYRNQYAAAKLAEKQKREAEAKRKLDTENEKVYFKTEYKKGLYNYFNTFLSGSLSKLQSLFNSMNLENFNEHKSKIIGFPSEYDPSSLMNSYIEQIHTAYIYGTDKMGIRNEVISELSKELKDLYAEQISIRKTEYQDLFNSKYHELKELDEAAKRDKEEFARLQAEKEERERKEAERLKQEETERARKQKEELEWQKQSDQMNNLFSAATVAVPFSEPKTKVTKKIKIHTPAGFLQVYQLWFEREGMKLSIDDLEKIHKKMITFCEKLANGKEEETINSPYIEYIDDVKAK